MWLGNFREQFGIRGGGGDVFFGMEGAGANWGAAYASATACAVAEFARSLGVSNHFNGTEQSQRLVTGKRRSAHNLPEVLGHEFGPHGFMTPTPCPPADTGRLTDF